MGELINYMYLEVGNMKDILNMCYWRFLSVVETLTKKKTIESGKTYVQKGLTDSQKDMIEKTKQKMIREGKLRE